MLCASGCNSGGQQLPTLLDVTSCTCLHPLLHVVGSCCAKFEPGQTLSYVQMDATTLNISRPFARGFTFNTVSIPLAGYSLEAISVS